MRARNVTVTAPGGTSNAVTFTVTGGTSNRVNLDLPDTGAQGTTQAVVLTGSGLTGATAVTVSGGAVTCTDYRHRLHVVKPPQINASFMITARSRTDSQERNVTTPSGTTGPVTFTIVAPGTPILSSISPTSGVRRTPRCIRLQ